MKYKEIRGKSGPIFTVGDKGKREEFTACCWVSPQPRYWHLAPDNSFLWEAVLCPVGRLAPSLTSTTNDSGTTPSPDNQKCFQTLPKCPLEGREGAKLGTPGCKPLAYWVYVPSTGRNCVYMVPLSWEQHAKNPLNTQAMVLSCP